MLSELHHEQESLTFPTWSRSIQHICTDNTAELVGLSVGAREVLTTHPALQTMMQSVNPPPSLRTADLLNHATDATLCIRQETFSMWSLLPGAPRGMWGSSQSTQGCHAQGVPTPSSPLAQNPPNRQSRVIQTQDQDKKSLKKPYKRTVILWNCWQIHSETSRCSCKEQWLEFQIWNMPPTSALQFLLKFSTGAEKTSYTH